MISIESLEENEFVRNLAKNISPQASFLWIGAKRTGSRLLDFEWENGTNFSYSNWMANEPNNYGGHQNYSYMRLSNGLWGDWKDEKDNELILICESPLADE
jgi:hypothetical protein